MTAAAQPRFLLFLCFCTALLATSAVAHAAPLQPKTKPIEITEDARPFEGKIVPLHVALEQRGIEFDEDAPKDAIALTAADGTTYTLIKDAGSRMFFSSDELHSRDFRLTAVQLPGTQLLKVQRVQSIVEGQLYDVDYWCDNCQLSYFEPGVCMCCGEFNELREVPTTEAAKPAEPAKTESTAAVLK